MPSQKLTTQQLEAKQKPEHCDFCGKEIYPDDAYLLVEIVGAMQLVEDSIKLRDRDARIFCSRDCLKSWLEVKE